MDRILEILKEIYLIDNLFDNSECDDKSLNSLGISIQKKFSERELKELNNILSGFNEILKNEIKG